MAQVEEPGDSEHIRCIVSRAELEQAKSLITFDAATGIFTMPMTQRENFFTFAGPPEVVLTNLARESDVWDQERVFKKHAVNSPTLKYVAHSDRDMYFLTEQGRETLRRQQKMKKLVVNVVYRCGKSKGKGGGERPNCRTLCGGQGEHDAACTSSKCKNCSFRVRVTATLAQVQLQQVQVELVGTHVPTGEVWKPPSLTNLKVSQGVLGDAVRMSEAIASNVKACADIQAKQLMDAEESRPKLPRNLGEGRSQVPEQANLSTIDYHSAFKQESSPAALYPYSSLTPLTTTVPGAPPSTPTKIFPKLMPTSKEVKQAKAAKKRSFAQMGGLSDWEVLHQVITMGLIPATIQQAENETYVVYYRPQGHADGPLIVLTHAFAIPHARQSSGGFTQIDAKWDLNDEKIPVTAVPVRTANDSVFPIFLAISRTENSVGTKVMFDAFTDFMPCGAEGCDCPVEWTMNPDGTFVCRRPCASKNPLSWEAIGADKHAGVMAGIRRLQTPARPSLCNYHCHAAHDRYVSLVIGLAAPECHVLGATLRLYQRGRDQDNSRWSDKWRELIKEVCESLVEAGKMDANAFFQLMVYYEAHWLAPHIRDAFMDERFLHVDGYETTNNDVENYWKHLDQQVFGGRTNSLVSDVLLKLVGKVANGGRSGQASAFELAQLKHDEAATDPGRALDAAANRRRSKAVLSVLQNSAAEQANLDGEGTVAVPPFNKEPIFDRDESEEIVTGLPEVLQSMHQACIRSAFPNVPKEQLDACFAGTHHLVNTAQRFCSCGFNIWFGPFGNVPCKHLDRQRILEDLASLSSEEQRYERKRMLVKKVASYLIHHERQRADSRRQDILSINTKTITCEGLLDLVGISSVESEKHGALLEADTQDLALLGQAVPITPVMSHHATAVTYDIEFPTMESIGLHLVWNPDWRALVVALATVSPASWGQNVRVVAGDARDARLLASDALVSVNGNVLHGDRANQEGQYRALTNASVDPICLRFQGDRNLGTKRGKASHTKKAKFKAAKASIANSQSRKNPSKAQKALAKRLVAQQTAGSSSLRASASASASASGSVPSVLADFMDLSKLEASVPNMMLSDVRNALNSTTFASQAVTANATDDRETWLD